MMIYDICCPCDEYCPLKKSCRPVTSVVRETMGVLILTIKI